MSRSFLLWGAVGFALDGCVFEDLEPKQRIFGEPRFVYEETLWPDDSDVEYLLLARERAFDGRYVTSMYRDESAPETGFYGGTAPRPVRAIRAVNP